MTQLMHLVTAPQLHVLIQRLPISVNLPVSARAHFIDDGGLEVDVNGTGHVRAGACLVEESAEGIISSPTCVVLGHLAIGLDAVLKTVQLPAGIADLDTGLADVDRDALTHVDVASKLKQGQNS